MLTCPPFHSSDPSCFLFFLPLLFFFFFFFNDTATTEIYTLSLHDALPIFHGGHGAPRRLHQRAGDVHHRQRDQDRKSTRLNSSHGYISYAVFCLKKKKKKKKQTTEYINKRTDSRTH